ncbi:MAG: deoxynucleoside kinase [Bacteroidetes bacterium]|nr:deoxynucleoside kinase [Bacteroidota bacterium]
MGIAGSIGSGKSSITTLLAKQYGFRPFFESVDDNPYLEDFYNDMSRWSFHLQIYFLSSRFRQQNQLAGSKESIIMDRTIYEDAEIFARNLYEIGKMDERDYQNYLAIYREMTSFLEIPDLLVYLRASVPTLVRQIQKRGRDYESAISIDYLNRLNSLYEDWIARYSMGPKLIIETDDLDFVNRAEDFGVVLQMIDRRLNNLFG